MVAIPVKAAVEGLTDEVALLRLAQAVGAEVGPIYGKSGKPNLQAKIDGYNAAAAHGPWVVLVDLDTDAQCAAQLVRDWLPEREPQMVLRVVVRALEAWLLADRAEIARFLRVPIAKVPQDPESIPRPKRTMVDLSRLSRRPQVVSDMVPREGSGLEVGPAYTSRMIEFIRERWDPDRAAANAPSLARCPARMREMVA